MTRKLKLCISVFEICHVVRFLVLYGVYGEGIWWWKQLAIVLKVSAPISWWCSASRSYTNAYMCNMLQYYKVRLPKELQDYKFACVIPIERGVCVSVYVVFVCVHRATFRVRFRMSNKPTSISHTTHTHLRPPVECACIPLTPTTFYVHTVVVCVCLILISLLAYAQSFRGIQI